MSATNMPDPDALKNAYIGYLKLHAVLTQGTDREEKAQIEAARAILGTYVTIVGGDETIQDNTVRNRMSAAWREAKTDWATTRAKELSATLKEYTGATKSGPVFTEWLEARLEAKGWSPSEIDQLAVLSLESEDAFQGPISADELLDKLSKRTKQIPATTTTTPSPQQQPPAKAATAAAAAIAKQTIQGKTPESKLEDDIVELEQELTKEGTQNIVSSVRRQLSSADFDKTKDAKSLDDLQKLIPLEDLVERLRDLKELGGLPKEICDIRKDLFNSGMSDGQILKTFLTVQKFSFSTYKGPVPKTLREACIRMGARKTTELLKEVEEWETARKQGKLDELEAQSTYSNSGLSYSSEEKLAENIVKANSTQAQESPSLKTARAIVGKEKFPQYLADMVACRELLQKLQEATGFNELQALKFVNLSLSSPLDTSPKTLEEFDALVKAGDLHDAFKAAVAFAKSTSGKNVQLGESSADAAAKDLVASTLGKFTGPTEQYRLTALKEALGAINADVKSKARTDLSTGEAALLETIVDGLRSADFRTVEAVQSYLTDKPVGRTLFTKIAPEVEKLVLAEEKAAETELTASGLKYSNAETLAKNIWNTSGQAAQEGISLGMVRKALGPARFRQCLACRKLLQEFIALGKTEQKALTLVNSSLTNELEPCPTTLEEFEARVEPEELHEAFKAALSIAKRASQQ